MLLYDTFSNLQITHSIKRCYNFAYIKYASHYFYSDLFLDFTRENFINSLFYISKNKYTLSKVYVIKSRRDIIMRYFIPGFFYESRYQFPRHDFFKVSHKKNDGEKFIHQ